MSGGGENSVGGIAVAAHEIAASEVTLCLHVTDDGLDGGAPAQFPFDRTEDAALLARNEDTVRVWRIVAAVSLVDIGALDLAAGEPLGVLDDGPQRVTIVRVAR